MVERSAQRVDGLKRLVAARAIPVIAQLGLMRPRPLDYEPPAARRQPAGDDRHALDVDRGLVLSVGGVEVRASSVVCLVEIHPDHQPVEGANSRHQRHIPNARAGWVMSLEFVIVGAGYSSTATVLGMGTGSIPDGTVDLFKV